MKHHWWQWLLIPFTLLTYIISIPFFFLYKPSSVKYYDGCLHLIDNTPNSRRTTIWGRPGGQSFGIRLIWYNTALGLAFAPLRVHECTHSWQGEVVNAVAHLILVPLSLLLGGGWWLVGAILLGQAAFGISYGVHFLYKYITVGSDPEKWDEDERWKEAYMGIWAEKMAYRVDDEFERGLRPGAWGS